jgi:hypothetical protein
MRDNKEQLYTAVQNSDVKAVEAILRQNKNLVNSTDKDGYTPLHFVQSKKIAEILLQNGANPIKEATKDGTTPAFWAQQLADKSIAQMISDAAKAATKKTEIIYEKLPPASLHNEILTALQNNDVGKLKSSLDKMSAQDMKELLNTPDNIGKKPIDYAKSRDAVESLIAAGSDAKVTFKTKDGPIDITNRFVDALFADNKSNPDALKDKNVVQTKCFIMGKIAHHIVDASTGQAKPNALEATAKAERFRKDNPKLNISDNDIKGVLEVLKVERMVETNIRPIDHAQSFNAIQTLIATGSDAKVTFETQDGPIDITHRFVDALRADNKSNPDVLKDKNAVQTKCFIMGKIAHHIVDAANGQAKPSALEAAVKAEKFRKDNPKLNISDNDIKLVLEVLKVEQMVEPTTKQEKPVAINALKKDNKIKPTFLERVAKKLHISSKGSSR